MKKEMYTEKGDREEQRKEGDVHRGRRQSTQRKETEYTEEGDREYTEEGDREGQREERETHRERR